MTDREHRAAAFESLNFALKHAGLGMTTLREWKVDKTFEHPCGLAMHHFYLSAKRVGEGVAHPALFDLSNALEEARDRND